MKIKSTNFTPYEIMYLMHVHCILDEYPYSPARDDADYRFIAQGLAERIMPDDTKNRINMNTIKLTDKGTALVNLILMTPMPKAVFIDPRTRQLLGSQDDKGGLQ